MIEGFLRQNPTVKIILVVLASAVITLMAMGSWLNKMEYSEKRMNNYFAALEQNCKRRQGMIPQFYKLIQDYAKGEQDLQQKLAKYVNTNQTQFSQKLLIDPALSRDFLNWQSEIAELLSQIDSKAKNYPDLAQNRQFLMLKMELNGIEQQISLTSQGLNREIEYFNSLVKGVPQEWVNIFYPREKPRIPLNIATSGLR